MRAVIAVAFVACLVFVTLTDGAAMKKKNKNKNKNECAAQEEALKMAGKWLCMMKREKLDMMIDHAESLSCFEDAKNMAMDQMRMGNWTMDDVEDMAGDMIDDVMDDDEDDVDEDEDVATEDEENKKNKKKNKKNKKAGFWDVGSFEMDFDGMDDMDMDAMKNMTMRDMVDGMGSCNKCAKKGCFAMNAKLFFKMGMMEKLFEKIEENGGCDGMTTPSA